MNIVCINGEFVELESARVAATDAGFLLGDGVFETIRVEMGQLLHAREHFARLTRAVRVLEIPFHVAMDDLVSLAQQVLDANQLEEARLRITLSRGPLRGHPIATTEGEPTLSIMASPLDPQTDRDRSRGWKAVALPFPRNHRSPLATIKSTSYLESTLGRRYAHKMGFSEGLFLNTEGFLAEGAMSNLFFVRGGTLYTPRVEDGALPGIVRAAVLRLAPECGIDCRERALALEDLLSSDEGFLTNAMIQVMPLVQVGERELGNGAPGPVTQKLIRALREEVELYLSSCRT